MSRQTTTAGRVRVLAGAALLASALAGGAFAALPAAGAADDDFTRISEQEWAWRVEAIGVEDDVDEARRIHSRLRDVSPAAQAAHARYLGEVLAGIDAIAEEDLSEEFRIHRAVYRSQIEALLARQAHRQYEMPLGSSGGFWTRLAAHARKPMSTEAELRRYLSLLGSVPGHFDQQIENMRAGLRRGFTQPRVVVEGRDDFIAEVANAGDPAATLFYGPFERLGDAIPEDTREALRAEARTVIGGQVIPAFRSLLAFMRDEYVPGARRSLAARDLPDGERYYRDRIREFVTQDMEPEAIHEMGLREVARLRAEMEATMREAGHEGDLRSFLDRLRQDPAFYPRTELELLKEAAWAANRFNRVVDRWFRTQPRMRFSIEAMPPESAPFSSYAVGGPGYYLVNTYDLPSRPLYVLTALTLHEAAPGHAFQMALAAENDRLPEFRRKVFMSAYGEGWGLYCEKLGDEMGLYETSYDRFGMLNYQVWRAARLVVDTGIHWKRWSREQAVAYMTENTSLSAREIETEVDRYIATPAQALSYYLGQMAIEEARERARQALGNAFDIRDFHEAVLSSGAVPLPVLHRIVDRYVESALAAGGT